MSISALKKEYKDQMITIPVSSIKLTEEIHRHGNKNYRCKYKSNDDCCVIVRRSRCGYALISSWADYMECKMQGYKNVNAIVVNYNRGEFVRRYGTDYIPLSELIVPDYMAKTQPKEWKLVRVRNRLGKKKKLDKPITLNKDRCIVDGYTRYLIAKEVGIKYVPVNWV